MPKKNALFFACDKRFFFTLSTALLSLKKNSPQALENADVLIYHQDFSPAEIDFLKNILPCKAIAYTFPLETDFEHENFKKFTQLSCARYDIFDLLDVYKKVLYIDVDVMIAGELQKIFDDFGDKGGIAMCKDTQKGRTLITKNFIEPPAGYDMSRPCYNSGVLLLCDNIKNRNKLRMWCYEKTVEWLNNLLCPDQGVLNVMIQEFGIDIEVMPAGFNCTPSSDLYYDKSSDKVLVYHCAGGGVRFWRYSYNKEWESFYKEYMDMGGRPYTDKDKAWRSFIKKHKLWRFDFFDRSPNPNVHPGRFIKYLLAYPFKRSSYLKNNGKSGNA